MLMVITYDVNTSQGDGEARLRKVARLCERYGTRVQNSVFEVMLDAAQLVTLKAEMSKLIDLKHDSIRFYRLGNSYENKIETMGRTQLVQIGGPLMF